MSLVAVSLLVVLSGCSTMDPNYRFVQKVGGVVGGAVAGNYIDRVSGGKGTAGGVVGAIVGGALVAGSQTSAVQSQSSGWWECKPGYGQVWEKQRNGKAVPACKEGVPQTPRPVQQTAQYDNQYSNNPGVLGAAQRGAADRRAMEQKAAERNAYCSQNPYSCSRGYGRHNYAGSYNDYVRGSSNIQWR